MPRIIKWPVKVRVPRQVPPARKPSLDIGDADKKASAAGGANVCRQRGRVRPALWLMPWSRRFEDPISLPDGRALRTLRDAASHVMALPGKTRQSDEWQTAIEALLMAAEDRGPLMHARIGVLRALNRNVERTLIDRKEMHWGKGKLKRDQQ
jgi:hypothetical protein